MRVCTLCAICSGCSCWLLQLMRWWRRRCCWWRRWFDDPIGCNSIRATTMVALAGYHRADSKTIASLDGVVAERTPNCHPRDTGLAREQVAGPHAPCWPCWRLLIQRPAVVSIYCDDFETKFLPAFR